VSPEGGRFIDAQRHAVGVAEIVPQGGGGAERVRTAASQFCSLSEEGNTDNDAQ